MNPAEKSDSGSIVKIGPPDGEKCSVTVDPKSAQSLIRFLMDKEIKLMPPEGGVARNPDYQIEMEGVPAAHSFFAYESCDRLNELAEEWRALAARPRG